MTFFTDEKVEQKFDCVEGLAITLILEMRKGSLSKWYDYIVMLPSNFDTIMEYWPDKFDDLLPPYLLEDKTASKRKRNHEFEKTKKLFETMGLSELTHEEYARAITLVFTRYKQDTLENWRLVLYFL